MKTLITSILIICNLSLFGQNLQKQTDSWEIPECAWKHDLGVRPKNIAETFKHKGTYTETITKKSIPLGGIGAGNLMFNICGSFGPFCFNPGDYKEIFLSQAAFHFFEEVENTKRAAVLATEDALPAWERIKPGQNEYYALFPRGWININQFTSEINMQFFSPVIKDNYKETSYPVGIFLFKIKNPTDKKIKIAIMFTYPNISNPAFVDTAKIPRKNYQPRMGLYNKIFREGNLSGIVMGANHKGNASEAQNTEWCIATDNSSGVVPSWDGTGDGSDIWTDFTDDGILNNTNYRSTELPCGAISVTQELMPGEVKIIPFVLTWNFPQTKFRSGTVWLKKYTAYYMQKEGVSFDIAKDALKNYSGWLDKIMEWTNPIITNPAYPGWLKQGAINELYYTTFGGSFWENGCITKPKKFGNRPGQNLCSVMECNEYRFCETFDVRHHGAVVYRMLWPEMEKSILQMYSDFIMDTKDGSCPHDAGSPDDDPFFNYDNYGLWYNNNPGLGIAGRATTPWAEFSPKFIQQCYAYYYKTKDVQFVKEVWQALIRTFRYQITTDINDDGLSEMKSSEYFENKLFNAVLWIGSLECMKEMCTLVGDETVLPEVVAQLNKARESTEKQFWNDSLGYYQYNETKDYLMADAMLGEHYIDITDLPPVLNEGRMTSHYKQVFRRLVLFLPDIDSDAIGDAGAGNALTPDSKPALGASEWEHQFEVWTGITYSLSSNLFAWGKRINDGALQSEALLTAWDIYRQSWLNEQNPYWFNTPEAWRINNTADFRALMYQRARAIWELLFVIDNPYK